MQAHLVNGRTALISLKAITWSKTARAINVHSDWSHPPQFPVRKWKSFHPCTLQCLIFGLEVAPVMEDDKLILTCGKLNSEQRSWVCCSSISSHGVVLSLSLPSWFSGTFQNWWGISQTYDVSWSTTKITLVNDFTCATAADLSRPAVCLETSTHFCTTSAWPVCDTTVPSKERSCCSGPLLSCSDIHQMKKNVTFKGTACPF